MSEHTPLKPDLKVDQPVVTPPTEPKSEQHIQISALTNALIESLNNIKKKPSPNDYSKLTVSQTVSFVAFLYEKVRNAIEYREDHLIRRAAIERITKRRLALNSTGKGEAENILRELLWARYFPSGGLGEEDTNKIQEILDKYLLLKQDIVAGRHGKHKEQLLEFLVDLMTCEMEDVLSPQESARESTFTFFIYQVLRQKIKIENTSEEQKDAYFLTALEQAYRKSDIPYQRYHLFITFYKPVSQYSVGELQQLSTKLPAIFTKIDELIKSPAVDKLTKYVRKQLPPFLILFHIINAKKEDELRSILSNREKMWSEVDKMCREKYVYTSSRRTNLAVRSLIYILVTKVLLALILEVPVSHYLYHKIDMLPIAINSLFPPFLMLFIVLLVKLPGEKNTQRIFNRIVEVVDADPSYETQVSYITKKPKNRRPLLAFGFTVFYSLTFFITLFLINEILNIFSFTIVSKALFIFFVSVVSFFAYRIKQIVSLYKLEEKEGFFQPFIDFFFIPILSLGKFFSSEVSKLNFFILIFDFIIEAPFKFIFEIVEEWISFVRQRKEEII